MTAPSYAALDALTILRRNLRRMRRYPSLTLLLIGMPLVFLLLFVYVFGGTLGSGLGGVSGGRAAYLAYVTPGILLMTVAAVAQGTAILVAMDMTGGIIARFRTMAISRGSVLTSHVLGNVIQSLVGVAVIIGVAIGIGYRTGAGPLAWIAAVGVLVMAAFAFAWLTVALGLVSRNVETASNLPMFLTILPFLGSGFVPTHSMPVGLRWFADYQPFTPINETVRGLLTPGVAIGHNAAVAAAWCVGIALVSYLWARRLYERFTVG